MCLVDRGMGSVGRVWSSRVVSLVVTLAVLAAACGSSGTTDDDAGGEGSGSGGTPDALSAEDVTVEPVSDPTELELSTERKAAELVLAELGDDAVGAVVSAIERGYSARQLIGGIGAGRLSVDGVIEEVEPAGRRANVFELADEPAAAGTAGGRPQMVLVAARSPVELTPLDTVEESIADFGENLDPLDPRGGGLAFLLLATHLGYAAEQIAEVLLAPDVYVFGTATLPRSPFTGSSDECLLLMDSSTGRPLIPAAAPVRPECHFVLSVLQDRAASEVFVRGELTGGAIVDSPSVVSVRENEIDFLLELEAGVVAGDAVISRESDTSNDTCTDRKVSPLGFTFEGRFVDDDQIRAEGTFTYRVMAEKFQQLELDGDCTGVRTFGTGSGTWNGTWDAGSGVFEGQFTVSSGSFGTNEFELQRVS